jgi:hypothetical protein
LSQYYLSKIIEGLNFEHDFATIWLPLLQNFEGPESSSQPDLSNLGAVSLAVVGVAAVEQNAKRKVLKHGTVQDFRLRAFNIHQSALTQEIFEHAQLYVLESLAKQKPELSEWVSSAIDQVRRKRMDIRKLVAAATAQLLYEIKGQQYRKGHRGRLEVYGGKGVKPAQHLLNLIDAEILKISCNSLPPSERNNVKAIRRNVRLTTRDFVLRGLLQTGIQTQAHAIDKHAKRLYRKLGVLTSR